MNKKQKDFQQVSEDANLQVQNWKMAYPERMIVLVEAKANEILFRKLLHPKCKFFIGQGWVKVETALKTAEKHKIHNIIGIIDADFKRITNYSLLENLFLTDFHDTEMMLAHSEAWGNMLNQYIDTEKLARFETQNKTNILNFLLKTLKPLSVLRFLKEKEALNLVFRTQNGNKYEYLKYKDFMDTQNLSINREKLLKVVENKSNSPNFFKNNLKYNTELLEFLKNDINLKEYTNGHDLTNALSIAFEKAISNKANTQSITGEEIEKTLMAAYRFSDFEQTDLYKNLENWQSKEPVFKLLK